MCGVRKKGKTSPFVANIPEELEASPKSSRFFNTWKPFECKQEIAKIITQDDSIRVRSFLIEIPAFRHTVLLSAKRKFCFGEGRKTSILS